MAARTRRRSGLPTETLLLVLGAVVFAGIGAFLLFRGGGVDGSSGAGGGIRSGEVAVPVAAFDLPSYTEIRLEHLIDPTTGELAVFYLPEESILESTIRDPLDLLGRVLARPKSAFVVMRESDLLPAGTRPGIVAGIPAGKRALRIDASKVSGIVGLRQGDRFDLVATYPSLGGNGAAQSVYGGGSGANARRARSAIVADGASVVSALESRVLPGAQPGRAGAVVQEMVIALAPDEIPRVTEALEIAKRIDCIPRSGLPGERPASEPDVVARAPRRSPYDEPVVDMIQGDRRSLQIVPDHALPAVGAGPAPSGR